MNKVTKNTEAANKLIGNDPKKIIDAVKVLKEASFENFDSTVSLSIDLNIDTRQAEQQIRGSIMLPAGTGKDIKVLAIVESGDADVAKAAGADIVEGLEVLNKIKTNNWFDFDVIVTTPKLMPELAKFGQILGPKGLMPNPKLGTVTTDLKTSIENLKKGQIEYKTDDQGVMNIAFGKKSFSDEDLAENFNTIYDKVFSLRPSTVKGIYIKSVYISTTMSPSVEIDVEK